MQDLKILSWNVNGLRAVLKKGFMEWLTSESPDILCLQETKMGEEQMPVELWGLEGYHKHFFSASKKGYSGVAIFSKAKPLSVQKGFGIERFDSEGRALIAEYDNFVLMNVYFPNGKMSGDRLQYKMDFYDAFLQYADSLKAQGKNLVICGDVNTAHMEIDLARPRENSKVSGFLPEERAWIDRLLSHGYLDTFRVFNAEGGHYSYWDMKTGARERNVGWRIDYFFVSESLRNNLKSAFIMREVTGSDHCPIGITVNI